MIYVGGTMVLLVFGVMLTAQSAFVSMKTERLRLAGGRVWSAASLLLLLFAVCAFSVDDWLRGPTQDPPPVDQRVTATRLGAGFLGMRVDVDRIKSNESLRAGHGRRT